MDNDYNNGINDPMNDEYVFMGEAVYDPGYDLDPATMDIKEVVGEAISDIPGILALKGGLSDIFKKDEDLTRGISVKKQDDDHVSVSAKVIAELGYNEADLIQQMTESITDELQAQMGLVAVGVNIDIAESMSEGEFYERYDAGRALH